MLHRLMFAGTLGVLFSLVVMSLIEQPDALGITAAGAIVLGWFSNDIFDSIFGER